MEYSELLVNAVNSQLTQACKLSGAKWSVCLQQTGAGWSIIQSTAISSSRLSAIKELLGKPEFTAWLAGGLQTGRMRSRSVGDSIKKIGCQRIFSFGKRRAEYVLLVGADGLSTDAQNLFWFLTQNIAIASLQASVLTNANLHQETRLRARNLDLIHQLVKQIVGMTDEVEIAQVTAELMAKYFNYEFALILVPDLERKMLINLGIGGIKSDIIEPGYAYPISMGITGRVVRTRQTYISNDITLEPDYYPILGWEAGSEICVPLIANNQVIGLINLESSQKGSFTESDQILIESLAGILSGVMMDARRNKLLEDKIHQLEAVRETALDIISELDISTLLKRVVHRACLLVHAQGAEIGLIEEDRSGIRVQTSENPWYDFSGHLIPIGKGIAGQVLQKGQPIRVADYSNWKHRLWPGTQVEFKSAAGVPLLIKNQVIGTLVVMDDRPGREFSDEDLQTLEMIGQNIALAIQNAQFYQILQESIDAQKQAESRLIQSERVAAAGRLTASIAHEINNPLQALENCLYLADRTELSQEERQKYISMARLELDRLTSTVQRMLDFYRPGARDRQSIDINDLLVRMIALVEPQLTRQGIEVHTNFTEPLPKVLVVSSQIQQVFLNLVLNAMEAMPGGGSLSIQTAPCESLVQTRSKSRKQGRPAGVEIIFRDSGPGVPVSEKEKIFEPFISTKVNGIGLGLSVSYGIIQAHGGTLSLLSEDQVGACFRIALPEERQL
jgi:signal transduction histidine kinase